MLSTEKIVAYFLSDHVESTLSDWNDPEHPLEYRSSDVSGDVPELQEIWKEFEEDVRLALRLFHKQWPTVLYLGYECIMDEDAAVDVLHTLNGAGVGIWDGRWDKFIEEKPEDPHYHAYWMKSLERYMKARLQLWADDTGCGILNDAFREAAAEWVRENLPEEVYRRTVLQEV